jgi:hypothetical protein
MRNYLLVAKNDTIKMYLENEIIFDGTNKYIQKSTDRFIDIGTDAKSDAEIFVKRFVYNIDGYYEAGDAKFADIRLEKFFGFVNMSIADISRKIMATLL